MFNWRRGRVGDLIARLDSVMQFQDLSFSEQRKMALDLTKLKDGQAKLVAVLQDLVNAVAAKNEQIATLTAQLARAQSDATSADQAVVDAAAADLADQADKIKAALPRDPPPVVPPPNPLSSPTP